MRLKPSIVLVFTNTWKKPWNNEQLKQVIQNGIERSNLLIRLKVANQDLEAKVQARTAELQAIFDHSADGIVVVDDHHHIRSMNPVALDWLGLNTQPPNSDLRDYLKLSQPNQSIENTTPIVTFTALSNGVVGQTSLSK